MKRFYFDGEEDGDEEDLERFYSSSPMDFVSMSHFDSPSSHLMDCAIRICEKSFFWRFMSVARKMDMVASVFFDLSEISKEQEKDADV